MKKLISVILLSILGVAAVSIAVPQAPRGQTWKPQRSLTSVEDFNSLKPGDMVAQVCKTCDTVSVIEIESKDQAMDFCKEGEIVGCPSCKKKVKVTFRGPRTESTRRVVRYVDDHGEACMFMSKVDSVGDTHKSIDRGAHAPHR